MSHELRNPLSVAEGNLQLAQEEVSHPRLDTVEQSLNRMEEMIDDLLELQSQGENVEDKEKATLETVFDSAWSNLDTKQAEYEVTENLTFECDKGRLEHLFLNFIRNSIEHERADVSISVGATEEGMYYEDNGPGFPDDTERLFEPGYTTSSDGSGFGLALVKEIVDSHGWTIEATESSTGGARFEINFHRSGV